jgi:hypothetical protein
VGHFLTLILYALGVREFMSRMHLWIFAMIISSSGFELKS